MAVILAGVSLATTACGGGDAGAAGKEITRLEEIPVELTVKMRGDINLTIDKQVITSTFVVRRVKDNEQADQQIVGVETLEPVAVDNMLVIVGGSIVPYKGDGKYTIEPGSIFDAAKEAEAAAKAGKKRQRSSVKVEWWPGSDIAGETVLFLRREKACKATISEEGTRGRIVCPVVTDEARSKRFSLDLAWDVP